jgi:hypothetical protein
MIEQVIGLPQDAVEKAGRLDGLARSKVAKEHGGMRHTVTVTADGFVWQDGPTQALSAVARAISRTLSRSHRALAICCPQRGRWFESRLRTKCRGYDCGYDLFVAVIL